MTLLPREAIEPWYADVPRSIRRSLVTGFSVGTLIFLGFGTWAATAPLAAAVVSHGTFVATGQNKLVQHYEGGIIRAIMVDEGDQVEKDQTLIVLDETVARTNTRRLMLRLASVEARTIRFQSLISGKDELDFSGIRVEAEDEAEVQRIFAGQRNVFRASRLALTSRIDVIERNRESLERRAKGSRAQRSAVERQQALIRQELAAKRILLDKGLYRRSDLFTIERAAAEAEGALGRIEGEIGDMESQIARLNGQIEQARQEVVQGATEDLQAAQVDLDDMREQLFAARSVLGRTEIRAPVAGTLVRLTYHTAGGVIESGRQIAEILPRDEALVIEALINPSDISQIHNGQTAGVRLTSFNQRTTPQLRGHIVYVSADTVADPRPGRSGDIYIVRVRLDEAEVARLHDLKVTPGMPADIYIETARRTFVDYVVKPVRDSMSRAFLER